jgi:hypothetical protein
VRHSASGAPHRLATLDRGSVLNAGDGTHEHPTQALLDAYTMRQRLGPAGRLPGRDRRRRAAQPGGPLERAAAATLGAEVTLVAPPTLLPVGRRRLAGRGLLRPGRRPAQGGRGDDAAGAAGADGAAFFPRPASTAAGTAWTAAGWRCCRHDAIVMHPAR